MMFFIIASFRFFVKLCSTFFAIDVILYNLIKTVIVVVFFIRIPYTALRTSVIAVMCNKISLLAHTYSLGGSSKSSPHLRHKCRQYGCRFLYSLFFG